MAVELLLHVGTNTNKNSCRLSFLILIKILEVSIILTHENMENIVEFLSFGLIFPYLKYSSKNIDKFKVKNYIIY